MPWATACLVFGAPARSDELLSPAQMAAVLRDAKVIHISNVHRKLGSPSDSYAAQCRKFKLSAVQISAFLRQAEPITANEWHYNFLQLPCDISGEARVGRVRFHWLVNGSATAWVSQLPVSGEESLILACKAGCKARKPFDVVADAQDVLDHHEDAPAK